MKKIVLTLAAVAAIGVAGCTPKADTANNMADVNATAENASIDVNASVNEAQTGNTVH
jgi:outer membrane lipoprotein-sorting protein